MTREERKARLEEIRTATPSDDRAIWQERQWLVQECDVLRAELERVEAEAVAAWRCEKATSAERGAAAARAERAERWRAGQEEAWSLISTHLGDIGIERVSDAVGRVVAERDAAVDASKEHVEEIEKLRHEAENLQWEAEHWFEQCRRVTKSLRKVEAERDRLLSETTVNHPPSKDVHTYAKDVHKYADDLVDALRASGAVAMRDRAAAMVATGPWYPPPDGVSIRDHLASVISKLPASGDYEAQ